MVKLQVSDIASQAFAGTGIGEKNTCSSGPDDGANPCQATHWWNVMRHATTAQAIDNLLAARIWSVTPKEPEIQTLGGILSTGAANIIGHGNEGLITTGMGQHGAYDSDKLVFNWNESSWGTQFDRVQSSGITYISLWACHPGAGQDGADLLYAIAKRCGRAVRGGTGFLYCNKNSIWWENGSQWQVATPTYKPPKIDAPSPHFIGANMTFVVDGKEVGEGDVISIRLQSIGFPEQAEVLKAFSGQDAKSVVARMFQSPPIDFSETYIPALITARIEIGLAGGKSVKLAVYNDRLAIDETTHTGYYISSVRSLIKIGEAR